MIHINVKTDKSFIIFIEIETSSFITFQMTIFILRLEFEYYLYVVRMSIFYIYEL